MDTTKTSNPDETIRIRRIQRPDIPIMAQIAATAYLYSDLNNFLCPYRFTYLNDYTHRFVQMIRARYFNPRCIGFVAVCSSNPNIPVGYAQFIRLGNDEAARRLIAAQSSFWQTLQGWCVGIWTWIEKLIWPDRSTDNEALRKFMAMAEIDDQRFWESPEMREKYGNRWHAQSVVVSEAFERRGIGRRLMGEVLQRAQREGVVVGLEASEDGEKLYRALGFELRGRFNMTLGSGGGGIMMWTPEEKL
ncbi:acyl-CoA N-acyltransferase [Aspergillus leporis]|jgi:ribosomal protein S18 acetylase RimI-like enzyme|uniref:Acyl-CoA N-acyltransferase n=1 Tax=Aspergillus leporis TaxID=41062 RepID=A0A5N5WLW1_9EURO|nr:acyl-CoA N-acyltransferase [Aspergillus leporis]